MASLRTDATTNDGGQSVLKVIKLASAVTSDTLTYKGPVKGWISVNETTADALSVTYSYSTKKFTIVVANTPDIAIYIIQ